MKKIQNKKYSIEELRKFERGGKQMYSEKELEAISILRGNNYVPPPPKPKRFDPRKGFDHLPKGVCRICLEKLEKCEGHKTLPRQNRPAYHYAELDMRVKHNNHKGAQK